MSQLNPTKKSETKKKNIRVIKISLRCSFFIRGRKIASGDKPKITHMSLRFSLHTGPVTSSSFFADFKMVSARVKTQQNIR